MHSPPIVRFEAPSKKLIWGVAPGELDLKLKVVGPTVTFVAPAQKLMGSLVVDGSEDRGLDWGLVLEFLKKSMGRVA